MKIQCFSDTACPFVFKENEIKNANKIILNGRQGVFILVNKIILNGRQGVFIL